MSHEGISPFGVSRGVYLCLSWTSWLSISVTKMKAQVQAQVVDWLDLHIGEGSPRLHPPHPSPPRGWLHPNPSLRSSSDASPSWRVTTFWMFLLPSTILLQSGLLRRSSMGAHGRDGGSPIVGRERRTSNSSGLGPEGRRGSQLQVSICFVIQALLSVFQMCYSWCYNWYMYLFY